MELRRRTFWLFSLLVLGHVLLISVQVQSTAGVPVAEAAAFGVFARVQRVTAGMADGLHGLWTNYVALRGVAAQNEDLRRQIAELDGQLQQTRAIAGEVHSLEGALGLAHRLPAPTLAARVIAGGASPSALTVTIDRGSADGLAPDMPVVAPDGVVGRLIHVSPRSGQVLLLIDRNAGAAVVFERSGAGGILSGGAGEPPLVVTFVPALADIKIGDRVLTSGQDRLFPPGLVVGTVERVAKRNDKLEVAVRPAVDFSHLDLVAVVLARTTGGAGDGS